MNFDIDEYNLSSVLTFIETFRIGAIVAMDGMDHQAECGHTCVCPFSYLHARLKATLQELHTLEVHALKLRGIGAEIKIAMDVYESLMPKETGDV